MKLTPVAILSALLLAGCPGTPNAPSADADAASVDAGSPEAAAAPLTPDSAKKPSGAPSAAPAKK